MLVNRTGAEAMQKNLKEIGPITYTEEELAFARELQKNTEVEEKGMVSEIKELEKPSIRK